MVICSLDILLRSAKRVCPAVKQLKITEDSCGVRATEHGGISHDMCENGIMRTTCKHSAIDKTMCSRKGHNRNTRIHLIVHPV